MILSKKKNWRIFSPIATNNFRHHFGYRMTRRITMVEELCRSFEEMFPLFYVVDSWWPWRVSTVPGKCLLRTPDGWIKRPCNEEQAFICQREEKREPVPLTIRCGNIQSLPLITSTISTTSETTRIVSSSTMKSLTKKTDSINPSKNFRMIVHSLFSHSVQTSSRQSSVELHWSSSS